MEARGGEIAPPAASVVYLDGTIAAITSNEPGRRAPERKGRTITADVVARTIAEIASDAKAEDIVVLGVRDLTPITDFFVICTADNERQLRAILNNIDEEMTKHGVKPRAVEGAAGSGWVLMDFSDVIVHVFGRNERAFYSLDKLWSSAQPVLVIQ